MAVENSSSRILQWVLENPPEYVVASTIGMPLPTSCQSLSVSLDITSLLILNFLWSYQALRCKTFILTKNRILKQGFC